MVDKPQGRRIYDEDGLEISSTNPFPVSVYGGSMTVNVDVGTVTSENAQDMKYKFALYQPTTTTLYMGWALPGVSPSVAGWRIVRYDFSGPIFGGDPEFIKSFANGTSGFDFIWASCTGYSY